MLILRDRAKVQTTGTGTGNLALSSLGSTFRDISQVVTNTTDTFYYTIAHRTASEWETGIGTLDASGNLVRTAANVIECSASTSLFNPGLVNFSAGTKDVFITMPATRLALSMPFANRRLVVPYDTSGRIHPAERSELYLGTSRVEWRPQTGTTVMPTQHNIVWTARNSGTAAAKAHPALATTSSYTLMRRAEFGTGSTTTGSSGESSTALALASANASLCPSWAFGARIGFGALSGTWGFMVGLSALAAALAGEPSAQNNTICFGKDSGDANYQFISRDTTAATKVNSGVAPAVGDIIDILITWDPVEGMFVEARRATDGSVIVASQTITTNLPNNSTLLSVWAAIRSASGTTAKTLGVARMRFESEW